jgi:hypothetical protein
MRSLKLPLDLRAQSLPTFVVEFFKQLPSNLATGRRSAGSRHPGFVSISLAADISHTAPENNGSKMIVRATA